MPIFKVYLKRYWEEKGWKLGVSQSHPLQGFL